ncbi:MAG: tetratricopeptide repeat protein [Nitrospirales bacterium]
MMKRQLYFFPTVIVLLMLFSVGACKTGDQRILDRDHQFNVHLQLGKLFQKTGHLENALPHFEQALAIKPSSDEIHYVIGLVYYEKFIRSHDMAGNRHVQKQFDNIQKQQINEHNTSQLEFSQLTHEEVEQLYEKKYSLRTDYKIRALEEFAQTLALNPDNWWAGYHIAVDHLNNRRFNIAIREYKKVIRSNPQLGISYSGLGNAYHELGNYDLAISNYKKAISLSKEMTSIDLDLAHAYLETGQKEKALKIYDEMKKQNHTLTYSLQLLIDGHSQR